MKGPSARGPSRAASQAVLSSGASPLWQVLVLEAVCGVSGSEQSLGTWGHQPPRPQRFVTESEEGTAGWARMPWGAGAPGSPATCLLGSSFLAGIAHLQALLGAHLRM